MTEPVRPPVDPQAVTDLLGVIAYGELIAFERLASDASLAPTLSDEAALGAMAVAEYGHFVRLRGVLAGRGIDPEAAMAPFVDALDGFHSSTAPSDWLESLVKAYVGDGIAADFFREVAQFVDEPTREVVLEVLADMGQTPFAVEHVRSAIEADPVVAGRLALWARRLVGEALAQAQRVAVEREALADMIAGGSDLGELIRLLARITDAHTARVASLGLST